MMKERNETPFGVPKKKWIAWTLSLMGILLFVALAILLMRHFGFFTWLTVADITGTTIQEKKFISDISRNRGWLVWGTITFIVAIAGVILTTWGRYTAQKQTQQDKEKNIHERYQNAADMLGSEVMSIRIAGCRALRQLAMDAENMWSPCAGLLFAYIKEPYFSPEEKNKLDEKLEEPIEDGDFTYTDKDLIHIFPFEMPTRFDDGDIEAAPLRVDIQEAINSVSAIYQFANSKGKSLKDGIVKLPLYFWRNETKGELCFAGANLKGHFLSPASLEKVNLKNADLRNAFCFGANFQDANLSGVNFEGASLGEANLKKANLSGANLKLADMEEADFREANLSGANLEEMNIVMADFRWADLSNMKIEESGVYGADITGIKGAESFTKKQILSAKWGIDENGRGKAPKLSRKLMMDKDIQEWSKIPDYEWKDGEKVINKEKNA